MSRTLLFLVGLGLLVARVPSTSADDGGLKLPNFNPFSSEEEKTDSKVKSPVRTATKVADNKSSEDGFSWPSYLKPKIPSLPKPAMPKLSVPTWASSNSKPKSRGVEPPSTWEKINNGTKSILTTTKNTLMPWTADDKTNTAHTSSSNRQHTTTKSTSRTKPKTEKKSIFSSWFTSKEEEKPIETVNDYLSLPRVPY